MAWNSGICQIAAEDKLQIALPSFATLLSRTMPSSTLRRIPHVDINTDSFYEVVLWRELKDKSIQEWLKLFEYRSDRTAYGTTSSEKKSIRKTDSMDEGEKSDSTSSSTKEHRIKEHERRVRHAIWQNQMDLLTGDFCYELATRNLHDFKIYSGHRTLAHASSGDKEPGKDQQLLASVLSALMSRWIVRYYSESLPAFESDMQSSQSAQSTRRSSPIFNSRPMRSKISKPSWRGSDGGSLSPRPSSPRKHGGQRWSGRFAYNVPLCRL